ncbi:ABC transporter substrate-binding protein [Streptomyces xantholiticus]|uniref:ABC transporter substrate-binding protein n=1 Tax=Streptomyces xantholiticus TaxID=68285 RepID=A0ABV1UTJ9_9ACTN
MSRQPNPFLRRACTAAAVTLALTLTATACSGSDGGANEDKSSDAGFAETGLPIVKERIELRFSGKKAPLAPDYEQMSLLKNLESSTNIDITWENLPENVYQEKKNLLLASGDLPDAFYNTGFTDTDIATYGANGTLIPLEDLIDKHAPNLKKVFAQRPEIRRAVTAPDGHIYTLPASEELGIGAVPSFWSINKTWLDKLGLPVPTTVGQYRDALKAFKDKDPNGNGKADEIPLSFIDKWWCADIGDLFAALSGLPDNPQHRIVRDGKVIFTANRPEYRDAVAELHRWYADGLIDPESFAQDDKQYLAKGKTKQEVLGSYVWWETEEVVGTDRKDDYSLMGPLKGPKGRLVGRSNGSDYGRDAFAITRANKYAAATMRWVDQLYAPQMSAQVAWGPIGEVFEKDARGKLRYLPVPEGTTAGELRQKVAPVGPRVVLREDFEKVVEPEARAKQRQQDLNRVYGPYLEKENYPPVFFTADELAQVTEIETDLLAMVDKQRAEWIVNGGVEKAWDGYVAELDRIGLPRLVEIYQAALDRYRESR